MYIILSNKFNYDHYDEEYHKCPNGANILCGNKYNFIAIVFESPIEKHRKKCLFSFRSTRNESNQIYRNRYELVITSRPIAKSIQSQYYDTEKIQSYFACILGFWQLLTTTRRTTFALDIRSKPGDVPTICNQTLKEST